MSAVTEQRDRTKEAERILRSATPVILEGYRAAPGSDPARREKLGTQEKTSFKDIVTVHDARVEAFLLEAFAKSFPGETLVGEEGMTKGTSAREVCEQFDSCWVIDPIDGTTNYSRAYPFFCTTAAFVTRAAPGKYQSVAGATWDPLRQEMFGASLGGGAWLNREQLKVTTVRDPREAFLTTGFAASRASSAEAAYALFVEITKMTLGVRRDGSAALDLAYVACGRTDGYWECGLSPWDVGAGALLVQEAGGQVTRHDGEAFEVLSGEILSSNAFLHKWLQNTLCKGLS